MCPAFASRRRGLRRSAPHGGGSRRSRASAKPTWEFAVEPVHLLCEDLLGEVAQLLEELGFTLLDVSHDLLQGVALVPYVVVGPALGLVRLVPFEDLGDENGHLTRAVDEVPSDGVRIGTGFPAQLLLRQVSDGPFEAVEPDPGEGLHSLYLLEN